MYSAGGINQVIHGVVHGCSNMPFRIPAVPAMQRAEAVISKTKEKNCGIVKSQLYY